MSPPVNSLPAKLNVLEGEPLAERTSLGLGGPAEYLVAVQSREELLAGLSFARERGLHVTVLGGGSNMVVADSGVPGLVLAMEMTGIEYLDAQRGGPLEQVRVRAEAGVCLDDLVADTVQRGLCGLECLSGIPGTVGATPLQNVGAYGCEVSQVIEEVQLLDLQSGAMVQMSGAMCDFSYRNSRFRAEPGRFVLLAVTFVLVRNAVPQLRYGELKQAFAGVDLTVCTPGTVRDKVLALRRSKSMLQDPADENGRSAGSFFKNPVMSVGEAERVAACFPASSQPPRHAAEGGQVKMPAAFLIEQSGFNKGYRPQVEGVVAPVAISTRHALCLVHHGGGQTSQLVMLAQEIQAGVRQRCGVTLHPEPIFVGFERPPLTGAVLNTACRLSSSPL